MIINIPKANFILGLLISGCLYTSIWAETFPPLDCSTSSASTCDSFIYLRNITEPIDVVASRFNISVDNITLFSGADYLAKVECSCSEFLQVRAFFYRLNYTLQVSDVGLVEREISDKYFSYTAWTENQFHEYRNIGEQVQLALGCGCPVPGWESIVSYAVPFGGTLSGMTLKFQSNMATIVKLNNISDINIVRTNRNYFIPYQKDGNTSIGSPAYSPSVEPSLWPSAQEDKERHKNKKLVPEIPGGLGGAVLLLGSLILLWYCGLCNRCFLPCSDSTPTDNVEANDRVVGTSEIITVMEIDDEKLEEMDKDLSFAAITNLTADEIIEIKSYCNESYGIGEGSFGKVYRGNLRGEEVAIKKIKRRGKDSRKLVENEITLLQGKQHKNLVGLIAWCIEEGVFYLVYDYVNGCTLEDYLRENCLGTFLGWERSLKIIQGIAEGINFLHNNKIIHVDIKPQNLMLDSIDQEVKIIDFGFSRHVNWEGTHRSTDRITGTRGYWAPEYCFNHNLSYKHDVFSFGIVVLEVITGQMHVDNARGSSQFHIPEYVKYMIANNRFEEAVDERIKKYNWDEHDVKTVMEVAELALRCAHKDKEERPQMDFVVTSLNSLADYYLEIVN